LGGSPRLDNKRKERSVMPNVGPLEIAVVLVIALVVFGPKRLPEIGKSMGKGMREFKQSVSGITGEDETSAVPAKPELPAATPVDPHA